MLITHNTALLIQTVAYELLVLADFKNLEKNNCGHSIDVLVYVHYLKEQIYLFSINMLVQFGQYYIKFNLIRAIFGNVNTERNSIYNTDIVVWALQTSLNYTFQIRIPK